MYAAIMWMSGRLVYVCFKIKVLSVLHLQETGIGKTVNSLRKHDTVGEAAKTLVARWKKLVPQAVDRWVDRGLSRVNAFWNKTNNFIGIIGIIKE